MAHSYVGPKLAVALEVMIGRPPIVGCTWAAHIGKLGGYCDVPESTLNQDQLAQGKRRTKRYEIYPERHTYSDGGQPEEVSVGDPLDDISFLYFVRTQPLVVGTTTAFPRHFKPGVNPVTLRVVRRDTIEAAGRRWATILVQPIIKTSTMFSDGSEARVWLSDDSARVIVQINTKLTIGSLTMKLRAYTPSTAVSQ